MKIDLGKVPVQKICRPPSKRTSARQAIISDARGHLCVAVLMTLVCLNSFSGQEAPISRTPRPEPAGPSHTPAIPKLGTRSAQGCSVEVWSTFVRYPRPAELPIACNLGPGKLLSRRLEQWGNGSHCRSAVEGESECQTDFRSARIKIPRLRERPSITCRLLENILEGESSDVKRVVGFA